jgi:ubiquinone biosynthesis protein UbiJ
MRSLAGEDVVRSSLLAYFCKNVEDIKDGNRSLENKISRLEEGSCKGINI